MHANPCCFRFLLFFLFARSNRICHAAGCLLWGRPSDVSLFRPVFSGYITGDLHAVTDEIGDTNAVGRIFQHCWIDREEKYDPRTDGSWGLPSGND